MKYLLCLDQNQNTNQVRIGNVFIRIILICFISELDIIGIDSQTNRLVFLASASDYENEVTLPTSLLKKHTNIVMYSHLIDSHVYVIKKWVVDYLKTLDSFNSIKGELLPHIIKKQLSKPPKAVNTNTSIINTGE